MNHKPYHSGSALVITLSLLILLSVCILAFMAVVRADRQSASLTAATTRAEILSRSAGNLVLSDLVSEIRDGSTNLGTASAVSFRANTNQNMLPQRVLANTNMATNAIFANLYKQSVSNAFYSGSNFTTNGPARASDVGTWEASRNGRVLSAERWNKPALLFGTGFSSTNQLPRWIYITRQETNGSALNPTTWSTNLPLASAANRDFVIGRAAYNIYEIGGLLDVNVAGHVTGTSKSQLMASLAGAAVTNMPGFTNGTILTAWRNAVTGTSASQFLSYAATNGLKEGFLDKVDGDRRFVGRQDLLAYIQKNPAGGIDTNALPYVTHFTRGLDRPSVQASTNTTLLAGYPNRPSNPAPLAFRRAADATLADGSTKLLAGDPVAFRRFPLRRLSLLTPTSTAVKSDTDPIYRYFGLYRASAAQPWTYDHGATNKILTLDAVPATREPDFFEMLQAAIASGSLGQSAGPWLSSYNPRYFTDSNSLDQNTYRQFLGIGACLIDQYDSDDIPTEIDFKDGSGNVISAFGIENLPYLNEVGIMGYRPATLPRTKLRSYLQFEVWNPHQNAPNADPNLKLRIAVVKGRVDLSVGTPSFGNGTGPAAFNTDLITQVAKAYGKPSATDADLTQFISDYPGLAFAPGSHAVTGVDFSNTSNQANYGLLEFQNGAQLQEPFLLTAPTDPTAPTSSYNVTGGGTTSSTSIVDEITPASLPLLDYQPPPKAPNPALPMISAGGKQFDSATPVRFAGIMVVDGDSPDDRADGRPDQLCYGVAAKVCSEVLNSTISAANAATIELQVQTPQGWIPYQRIQNIRAVSTSNRRTTWGSSGSIPIDQASSIDFIRPMVGNRSVGGTTYPIYYGSNVSFAIDPRTARFTYIIRDANGPSSGPNISSATNADMAGNKASTGTGTATDWLGTSNPSAKFTQLAANISNDPDGGQYYADPDGTVRRGDGEERPEVASADRVNPIFGASDLRGAMLGRPVLLNRPFQSVGEMGYAFRDLPWKTMDLWSGTSGDGALLDYFCIEETALDANRRPLRAGVINVNTAPEPVLEAVIRDAISKEIAQSPLTASQVTEIAQSVAASVAGSPLNSIADLPRLADSSSFPVSTDKILRKTEKEAFLRALAPVVEENVWNVMIDVVAQTGRFPPGAANLKDFAVQGEARYWIFAAIDRTTGEIIDTQFELVTE